MDQIGSLLRKVGTDQVLSLRVRKSFFVFDVLNYITKTSKSQYIVSFSVYIPHSILCVIALELIGFRPVMFALRQEN